MSGSRRGCNRAKPPWPAWSPELSYPVEQAAPTIQKSLQGRPTPAKRPFAPLPPGKLVPGPTLEEADGGFGSGPGGSGLIYIDSSILLASVFREPRSPPATLWEEDLASSRLLEYEVWNRLNAYGVLASHGDRAQARVARVNLTALSEATLTRALEPFPAWCSDARCATSRDHGFYAGTGCIRELASYDNRLIAAAQALGISIAPSCDRSPNGRAGVPR